MLSLADVIPTGVMPAQDERTWTLARVAQIGSSLLGVQFDGPKGEIVKVPYVTGSYAVGGTCIVQRNPLSSMGLLVTQPWSPSYSDAGCPVLTPRRGTLDVVIRPARTGRTWTDGSRGLVASADLALGEAVGFADYGGQICGLGTSAMPMTIQLERIDTTGPVTAHPVHLSAVASVPTQPFQALAVMSSPSLLRGQTVEFEVSTALRDVLLDGRARVLVATSDVSITIAGMSAAEGMAVRIGSR